MFIRSKFSFCVGRQFVFVTKGGVQGQLSKPKLIVEIYAKNCKKHESICEHVKTEAEKRGWSKSHAAKVALKMVDCDKKFPGITHILNMRLWT